MNEEEALAILGEPDMRDADYTLKENWTKGAHLTLRSAEAFKFLDGVSFLPKKDFRFPHNRIEWQACYKAWWNEELIGDSATADLLAWSLLISIEKWGGGSPWAKDVNNTAKEKDH